MKRTSTIKTQTNPKNKVSTSTRTTKSSWLMNPNQRLQKQLAKINQSTAKSAISEVGKTIRSVTSQVAATKGYQTYAGSQQIARKEAAAKAADSLDVYRNIISGNADQEGESGSESTTKVGGAGSALGG